MPHFDTLDLQHQTAVFIPCIKWHWWLQMIAAYRQAHSSRHWLGLRAGSHSVLC